jgi:hypothetical protein
LHKAGFYFQEINRYTGKKSIKNLKIKLFSSSECVSLSEILLYAKSWQIEGQSEAFPKGHASWLGVGAGQCAGVSLAELVDSSGTHSAGGSTTN